MPLDLHRVSAQLEAMASDIQAQGQEHAERLRAARATLALVDGASINQRRQAGRFAWAVPELPSAPSVRHTPVEPPSDYRALATDGSHIDVERHLAARCALVNMSKIVLQYGSHPDARLESYPALYAGESLSIPIPGETRDQPLEGPLLGIKRSIDEVVALAELAEEAAADGTPAVALIDGSLILWGPAGQQYPDYVRQATLEERLLPALDRLKAVADKQPLVLAAYVSMPRSSGVVDALRLAVCPFPAANCNANCGHLSLSQPFLYRKGQRPCEKVGGLMDRELFSQTLAAGERTALFGSGSSIVQRYYGGHQVSFFYLNVGEEIARVEVPAWVAEDETLLSLSHSLILDQCRKGLGYPVAIMEAHEQAVIGGAERDLFRQMVEDALAERRLPVYTSEKARSKRLRWL